jgi:hypothetical protein
MGLESAISKLKAERAEVEAVLSAGVLGRTNNLVRLMTYVCEKYFEGAIDDIRNTASRCTPLVAGKPLTHR